jgi:hypothetical protein
MTPLLLAALVGSAQAEERRYALLIGANRGDASDQTLKYAGRDAQRFSEVLRTLGEVPASNLTLLSDPDVTEVRSAMDRLETRIAAEVSPADTALLFVYYSGHADAADLHLDGTRFPLTELKRRVGDSSADAKVLVVDACRAGELTRMKGATPAEPFTININNAGTHEGMAIITSAAPGEDAQESDRLQGGVFTHHFIAGLQGAADQSGDHRVTLTEAYSYSFDRTLMTTSSAPLLQHPISNFAMTSQGDLVVTQLDGARRVGYLSLAEAGSYVVFDPKGAALVSELEVSSGGRIALTEGAYLLRKRTPAKVYQTNITISQGQTTTIQTSEMRQLPYGQTARRGDTTERRIAVGLIAGAAMEQSLSLGMSAPIGGTLGVRLDMPALTLDARARYAASSGENDYLTIEQTLLSADLSAYRLYDIRRASLGAGLRVGGAWIQQDYITTGEAPSTSTLAPYASPLLRAEVSVTPRLSLGLEGGISTYLIPSQDSSPPFRTVPYVAIDLTGFVF